MRASARRQDSGLGAHHGSLAPGSSVPGACRAGELRCRGGLDLRQPYPVCTQGRLRPLSAEPWSRIAGRSKQRASNLSLLPRSRRCIPPAPALSSKWRGLSDRLDGASRPGHFRGVATVVAKLFHIVAPDHAFFGQKDAAQVAVLRKMVRDLRFALELDVCPTVREPDGLALSSRNRYLSGEERRQALVLSRALQRGRAAGPRRASMTQLKLLARGAADPWGRACGAGGLLPIVDPDTLEDVPDVRHGALVAVAACVGATRLIDNLLV